MIAAPLNRLFGALRRRPAEQGGRAAGIAPAAEEIAVAWAGGERFPALVQESAPTGTRLSGDQLARRLGEGLDFEQLRAYQAGEPAARIDWRISARTEEPVVRVHREPAQRQAHLVIDCTAAMRFGTRRRLKLTQGLLAAHAFAAGALRQNLAVEIHPVGEAFPPGLHAPGPVTGQSAILQRLAEVADAAGGASGVEQPVDWPALRERLARRLPAGSLLIVLSDCLSDTGPGRAIDWAPLAAEQHLLFVSIADRVELDMPDLGLVAFEAGARTRWLDTGDRRWREAFASGQQQRLQAWRESAEALGTTFLPLAADTEPTDWLATVPAVLAGAAGVAS
ncbi:MAG: DUF58 domain-containing protein [Pseudomonadota bacterium]